MNINSNHTIYGMPTRVAFREQGPERKSIVLRRSRGHIIPWTLVVTSLSSLIFCVNAAGTYLPPFTVYKAQNLWFQWTRGGDEDFMYGCSPSGWMEGFNFEAWFCENFVHLTKMVKELVYLSLMGIIPTFPIKWPRLLMTATFIFCVYHLIQAMLSNHWTWLALNLLR